MTQVGSVDGRWHRWRAAVECLGALAAYQTVAIVFYGRALITHLKTIHGGGGPDPQFFIWCFAWWPYAIAHRLNPVMANAIWAPDGFNLAWSTSVPLQSLIAAPLTSWLGPIASFNLAWVIFPALSAFAAFILIRRLVGGIWPAFFGGYLFGFSPFMIGHQGGGHLVLTAAFLIPLAVYVIVLRLQGSIGMPAQVALLALILWCQALMSLEVFATMVLFGAIGLVAAYLVMPELKPNLVSASVGCVFALGTGVILLSPLLFYALKAGGMGTHPVWFRHSDADLIELIVPSDFFMVGRLPGLGAIAARYQLPRSATGGYVGLPLLIVTIVSMRLQWQVARIRFLAVMLVVIYVAMLGARLHVGGRELFGMPWKLFAKLPFLNSAGPDRFALYLDLALAIVAADFMSKVSWPAAAKLAAGVAIITFALPNPSAPFWSRDPKTPEFFSSGLYRSHLKPAETILALPFGLAGNAMIWQAQARMYFRMANAWTGPPPRSFEAWPIVIDAFEHGLEIPDEADQLHAFLATHGVSAVVIAEDDPRASFWRGLLATRGATVEESGGVIVARPSSRALAPFLRVTSLEMECRYDAARFARLVDAAARYLEQGYPLDRLTPLEAQEKGLLPSNWVNASEHGNFVTGGMLLGQWDDGGVGVGVNASYGCVKALLQDDKLHPYKIFYPYPRPLTQHPSGDLFQRKLVVVFTREQLERAAHMNASGAQPLKSGAGTAAP